MSLPSRSRRLIQITSTGLRQPNISVSVHPSQKRTAFWNFKKDVSVPARPLTEEYLKRKPEQGMTLVRGGLASSSILEDEEIAGPKPAKALEGKDAQPAFVRNPTVMAAALDPDPNSRKRWERKMVIRDIQKRGRQTRLQLLKKQERELQSKSHNIKTSVKKLGPLARQIVGKTVEDAIIQMRFSKKKAANSVKAHLEHARNEAIVRRGMGLGSGDANFRPTTIQTKDGNRIKVDDPTTLYVDQAWVGKGDFGKTPDHRARGQIYIMENPTTHIALILKEEATRIRQHEDREKKLKDRKVWTQLPNRPINGQRQFYSW